MDILKSKVEFLFDKLGYGEEDWKNYLNKGEDDKRKEKLIKDSTLF